MNFVPNDSNTWITNHNNRFFMVYQFNGLFWTNEISESKKVIVSLYYSGKSWEAVENHILDFYKKNQATLEK